MIQAHPKVAEFWKGSRDADGRRLESKEKIYKLADRDGLYVRVMPSGAERSGKAAPLR
jgi:hypothetical protein